MQASVKKINSIPAETNIGTYVLPSRKLPYFSALFSPKQVYHYFLGWFGKEKEWDFYQEGNLEYCLLTV